VQAFESFVAMIKLANMQRSKVEDASRMAMQEFTEGGRAVAGAMGGVAGMIGAEPGKFAKDLLDGAADYSVRSVVNGGIDGSSIVGNPGGEQMLVNTHGNTTVAAYAMSADAMLQRLGEGLVSHGGIPVLNTNPGTIIASSNEVMTGRVNELLWKQTSADAFNVLSGDGSFVDSALRTSLKATLDYASLGTAGKAVDVAGIIGSSAQAKIHFETGAAAWQLATTGAMTSLENAALALRLPVPSPAA
jgi:hypothetical protein